MSPISSPPSPVPFPAPAATRMSPPSTFDQLDPEAREVMDRLWDPSGAGVDLRDLAPECLDAIAMHWLNHCDDARFVALPAFCSVPAIHTLMAGLPALEGLFIWSPRGAEPIRPLLGRHLKTVVTDVDTLTRLRGADYVTRVASGARDLPVDALSWLDIVGTVKRPHETYRPTRREGLGCPGGRPLTLYQQAAPPADGVAARLAAWDTSAPVPSRGPSPGADMAAGRDLAEVLPKKTTRSRSLERLRSVWQALFKGNPLRRSQSA